MAKAKKHLDRKYVTGITAHTGTDIAVAVKPVRLTVVAHDPLGSNLPQRLNDQRHREAVASYILELASNKETATAFLTSIGVVVNGRLAPSYGGTK